MSVEITRSRGLQLGYVEREVPAALLPLTQPAGSPWLPLREESRDSDSWRADVVLDEFAAPDR